jgi:predicted ABC-type sugar transport system permease subunit
MGASLGSSLTGDAEVTMFFVSTRTDSSTGGAQGMVSWVSNQISCADGFGNQSRFTTAGLNNNSNVATTAVLTAAIQTFVALSGGANLWRFWRNGTSIAPTAAATSGGLRAISSPIFSLGVVGNVGFHNGLISEVVLYSRALSATEVVSINRYLGSKWNITVA